MNKSNVLKAVASEPSIGMGYRDVMNVMHRIAQKPIYTYSYEFPKKGFEELEGLICHCYPNFEINRYKLIHHQKNGWPFYELNLIDNVLIEIRDSQDDFVDKSITIYCFNDLDEFNLGEYQTNSANLKQNLDSYLLL